MLSIVTIWRRDPYLEWFSATGTSEVPGVIRYDTVSDVEERAADLAETGKPMRLPLKSHVQAEPQVPRL